MPTSDVTAAQQILNPVISARRTVAERTEHEIERLVLCAHHVVKRPL